LETKWNLPLPAKQNVTQMLQIGAAGGIRRVINNAQPLSPLFGGEVYGLYQAPQLSYLA
jgi:hypothetical protein